MRAVLGGCTAQQGMLHVLLLFAVVTAGFGHDAPILSRRATSDSEELNLEANNYLTLLPNNFFEFPKLRVLKLHKNLISYLPPFMESTVLSTLDLSRNSISSIHKDAFAGIPNLELLLLNDNVIHRIEPGTFSVLQHLLILDLTNNHIMSMFQYELVHMDTTNLRLEGNECVCTKQIVWFCQCPRDSGPEDRCIQSRDADCGATSLTPSAHGCDEVHRANRTVQCNCARNQLGELRVIFNCTTHEFTCEEACLANLPCHTSRRDCIETHDERCAFLVDTNHVTPEGEEEADVRCSIGARLGEFPVACGGSMRLCSAPSFALSDAQRALVFRSGCIAWRGDEGASSEPDLKTTHSRVCDIEIEKESGYCECAGKRMLGFDSIRALRASCDAICQLLASCARIGPESCVFDEQTGKCLTLLTVKPSHNDWIQVYDIRGPLEGVCAEPFPLYLERRDPALQSSCVQDAGNVKAVCNADASEFGPVPCSRQGCQASPGPILEYWLGDGYTLQRLPILGFYGFGPRPTDVFIGQPAYVALTEDLCVTSPTRNNFATVLIASWSSACSLDTQLEVAEAKKFKLVIFFLLDSASAGPIMINPWYFAGGHKIASLFVSEVEPMSISRIQAIHLQDVGPYNAFDCSNRMLLFDDVESHVDADMLRRFEGVFILQDNVYNDFRPVYLHSVGFALVWTQLESYSGSGWHVFESPQRDAPVRLRKLPGKSWQYRHGSEWRDVLASFDCVEPSATNQLPPFAAVGVTIDASFETVPCFEQTDCWHIKATRWANGQPPFVCSAILMTAQPPPLSFGNCSWTPPTFSQLWTAGDVYMFSMDLRGAQSLVALRPRIACAFDFLPCADNSRCFAEELTCNGVNDCVLDHKDEIDCPSAPDRPQSLNCSSSLIFAPEYNVTCNAETAECTVRCRNSNVSEIVACDSQFPEFFALQCTDDCALQCGSGAYCQAEGAKQHCVCFDSSRVFQDGACVLVEADTAQVMLPAQNLLVCAEGYRHAIQITRDLAPLPWTSINSPAIVLQRLQVGFATCVPRCPESDVEENALHHRIVLPSMNVEAKCNGAPMNFHIQPLPSTTALYSNVRVSGTFSSGEPFSFDAGGFVRPTTDFCRAYDPHRILDQDSFFDWGLATTFDLRVRKCTRDCPQNCELLPWSTWSPCTPVCGHFSSRSRTRAVRVPAANGGQPCSVTAETQACDVGCVFRRILSSGVVFEGSEEQVGLISISKPADVRHIAIVFTPTANVTEVGLGSNKLEVIRPPNGQKAVVEFEFSDTAENKLFLFQPGVTNASVEYEPDFRCDTGGWTAWTSCSQSCGFGLARRTRALSKNDRPELCMHTPLEEFAPCHLAECSPSAFLLDSIACNFSRAIAPSQGCTEDSFTCDNELRCIDLERVCDGVQDCSSGNDEPSFAYEISDADVIDPELCNVVCFSQMHFTPLSRRHFLVKFSPRGIECECPEPAILGEFEPGDFRTSIFLPFENKTTALIFRFFGHRLGVSGGIPVILLDKFSGSPLCVPRHVNCNLASCYLGQTCFNTLTGTKCAAAHDASDQCHPNATYTEDACVCDSGFVGNGLECCQESTLAGFCDHTDGCCSRNCGKLSLFGSFAAPNRGLRFKLELPGHRHVVFRSKFLFSHQLDIALVLLADGEIVHQVSPEQSLVQSNLCSDQPFFLDVVTGFVHSSSTLDFRIVPLYSTEIQEKFSYSVYDVDFSPFEAGCDIPEVCDALKNETVCYDVGLRTTCGCSIGHIPDDETDSCIARCPQKLSGTGSAASFGA
eukprot:m.173500 g.173500  ORF g.173500 m.173500 type:complete len:1773 (-) comp10408_c0_seq3:1877-7195(-)